MPSDSRKDGAENKRPFPGFCSNIKSVYDYNVIPVLPKEKAETVLDELEPTSTHPSSTHSSSAPVPLAQILPYTTKPPVLIVVALEKDENGNEMHMEGSECQEQPSTYHTANIHGTLALEEFFSWTFHKLLHNSKAPVDVNHDSSAPPGEPGRFHGQEGQVLLLLPKASTSSQSQSENFVRQVYSLISENVPCCMADFHTQDRSHENGISAFLRTTGTVSPLLLSHQRRHRRANDGQRSVNTSSLTASLHLIIDGFPLKLYSLPFIAGTSSIDASEKYFADRVEYDIIKESLESALQEVYEDRIPRMQQVREGSKLPAIIVHGGSRLVGSKPSPNGDSISVEGGRAHSPLSERDIQLSAGVALAVERGYRQLLTGGTALDAVEDAVRSMENDVIFNAGRGGDLTELGGVELDAIVMVDHQRTDAASKSTANDCGAVACVSSTSNPITLARKVMEKTPHCLLVGQGAERFAKEQNLALDNAEEYLVTEKSKQLLQKVFANRKAETNKSQCQLNGHQSVDQIPTQVELSQINSSESDKRNSVIDSCDTVGAVAIDSFGTLTAATSTGGMSGKRPGRVGDSPIIGSGAFVDARGGAASTTGHGEKIMRSVMATRAVIEMQRLVDKKEKRSKKLGGLQDSLKGLLVGSSQAQSISIAQRAAELAVRELGSDRAGNGVGGIIVVDREGEIGHAFNSAAMSWASGKHGKLSVGLYE